MEIEVARRLVAAWHKNYRIYTEIKKGLLEAGIIPTPREVNAQLGLEWLANSYRAKAFFSDHCSIASDMLWAGKADEQVAQFLTKVPPDKHRRHPTKPRSVKDGTKFIHWRKLDKRHDWQTVK